MKINHYNILFMLVCALLSWSMQANIITKISKTGLTGSKTIPEYQGKKIALELWNKTSGPVRIRITNNTADLANPTAFEDLPANEVAYRQEISETESPGGASRTAFSATSHVSPFRTIYIIVKDPQNRTTYFQLQPGGRTVYLTLKSDRSGVNLASQSGALKGLVKSTDTGLSLKNNITDADITKLSQSAIDAIEKKRAAASQAAFEQQLRK